MIIGDEELISSMAMNATSQGVSIAIRVASGNTRKALTAALRAARNLIQQGISTPLKQGGEVSLPTLTAQAHSDIRVLPINSEYVEEIRSTLARSGVLFHIESGETESFIHLEGKNAEELAHAITKLENKYPTLIQDATDAPTHTESADMPSAGLVGKQAGKKEGPIVIDSKKALRAEINRRATTHHTAHTIPAPKPRRTPTRH